MDTHINMESNLEEQKVSASVVNPSFQLFLRVFTCKCGRCCSDAESLAKSKLLRGNLLFPPTGCCCCIQFRKLFAKIFHTDTPVV